MDNLSRFKKEELELIINTNSGEVFSSQGMLARMCKASSKQIAQYTRGDTESIKTLPVMDSRGVIQPTKLYSEKLIKKCLVKYNPELLDECLDIGLRAKLHQMAGYEILSTAIESDREKLEQKFLPTPEIKQIKETTFLFKDIFGEAYAQRYVLQQVKKHYPQLAGEHPQPQETTSLPTAKALLTPTQIAEQLGWNYKTGSPNPRRVNCLLVQLGYQEKIDRQWNATDKAIQANLCDRKPVDTNSRTQKDQLLWSSKVIDILREHSFV